MNSITKSLSLLRIYAVKAVKVMFVPASVMPPPNPPPERAWVYVEPVKLYADKRMR